MLFLPINRNQVLQLLPANGIGAEIGVLEGDFSQEILTKALPSQLHLIDPWCHQEREDYQKDHANAEDAIQDMRYHNLKRRFEEQISAGQVHVYREYSGVAVDQFEDKSLDWVYIDAVHSYEGALADLKAFAPKIKDDGFILGHDFTNSPPARKMEFGVVEAVKDFLSESGWSFLALTAENFPTYVLARDSASPNAQNLIGDCILKIPFVVEIKDPFRSGPHHRQVHYPDKTIRYVMSF